MNSYPMLKFYGMFLRAGGLVLIVLGSLAAVILVVGGFLTGETLTGIGVGCGTLLATLLVSIPWLVSAEVVFAYRDMAENTTWLREDGPATRRLLAELIGAHAAHETARAEDASRQQAILAEQAKLLTEQCQYLSEVASRS